MGDKNIWSTKLEFREVVVLAIVVSFLTAATTGFIVSGMGSFFFNQDNLISQSESAQNDQKTILLDSKEEAVVKAVEKASPAVVSIIVTKDLPVLEKYYQEYNPFGNDEFFEQFFGEGFFDSFNFSVPKYRQQGTEQREVGGGTGFIVSSDGMIVTNRHVVADKEATYTVLTNQGEKFSAQVLARDPVEDIALLKIDKTGLSVIQLGSSENLKIGQTAIAIGNALGEYRNTVSLGVISGLMRSIQAASGYGQLEQLSGVIQTDAAINPGNSGGPLLNLQGEAIGVNVAMAQGAQNIGFALPIDKVKRDIEQVEKTGKISYPFLGIRYVLINQEIKDEKNLSVDYGALIIRGEQANEPAIIPDSPADRAGLQENDIILEFNNQKINQQNNLAKLIQECQINEQVELKILRQGEEKIVQVELGER